MAISATETAMNSAGSALKENEKYLDSIEGKTNQLNSAWQNLSRNIINSNFVKSILDISTTFLKLIDSIGGLNGIITIAIPLLIAFKSELVASLLYKSLVLLIGAFAGVKTAISTFIFAIPNAITALQSLKAGIISTTAAAEICAPALGLISAALLIGITLWKKYGDSVSKAKEDFENSSDAYQNAVNELEDVNSQLENKKKTLEEMESIKNPKLSDKNETEMLKTDISLLEDKKKLLEDIEESSKKEAAKSAEKILTSKEKVGTGSYAVKLGGNIGMTTGLEETYEYADHIEKVNIELEKYQKIQSIINGKQKNNTHKSVEQLGTDLDNLEKSIQYTVSDLYKYKEALLNVDEETRKQKGYDELIRRIDDATGSYNNFFNKIKESKSNPANLDSILNPEGFQEFSKQMDKASEELDKLLNKISTEGAMDSTNLEKYIDENFSGVSDTIKSNIKDIVNTYQDGSISIEQAKEQLNLSFGKQILDETIEIVNNELADAFGNNTDIVDGMIDSYEELASVLENVGETMSNLKTAQEEMNDTGSLSASTVIDLLSKGDEYADVLEVVDGKVRLVANAEEILTERKIDAARKSAELAVASAEEALAQYDAGNASTSLGNTMSGLSKVASVTAAVMTALQAAISGKDISGVKNAYNSIKNQLSQFNSEMTVTAGGREQLVANLESAKKRLEILNSITPSSLSASYGRRSIKSKSGKSSSKSTKDTWKEQFEKEYDALKHQLNMNEITEKEYTDRLEVMYKKYFSDKSKYLDEYNKYEEEVYKNRKKLMEDEIDELEKVLKKQRELAEDKYDNAVKVATNAIDERIEALKKQKEALEENNDEQERAIELAKLQDELERAKTQKTMRVFYADRGFVYESDKNAIEEAQKALDDFNAETAKEEQTKAIDAQIEELENLKDGWSNVASNYEMQQARIKAALEMGNNFEEDVLNKRLEYLRNFVNEYNATMDKLGIDEKNLVKYASSLGIDISDKYATGTLYANGGLSLVGEQGAELRVLNQGDGIIPADLTKNLMSWGQMNPVNFFKEMFSPKYSPITAGTGGSDTIYNFSNLTINSDANNLDALIRDIQIKSKNR